MRLAAFLGLALLIPPSLWLSVEGACPTIRLAKGFNGEVDNAGVVVI